LKVELGPYAKKNGEFKSFEGKELVCAQEIRQAWNKTHAEAASEYPPKPLFQYRWEKYLTRREEQEKEIKERPHFCYICRKGWATQQGFQGHSERKSYRDAHQKFDEVMETPQSSEGSEETAQSSGPETADIIPETGDQEDEAVASM